MSLEAGGYSVDRCDRANEGLWSTLLGSLREDSEVMAKSVLSAIMKASRAAAREAERQQRAATREYNASIKRAEQARKAEERALAKAARAAEADRKRLEKEAKAAYVASMEAKAEESNADLARIYDDIDGLLAATLDVDDYVDLESLRRTVESSQFDRADLLKPAPPLEPIPLPDEPMYLRPAPPKGLFRRAKKHAEAIEMAEVAHAEAHAAWKLKAADVQARRKDAAEQYALAERRRRAELEHEQARFAKEIEDHNKKLDALISNLGYGTPEAVQEYVSIVVANSVYPDHFPVDHESEFDPATAELALKVTIPPPQDIPSVKAYKYVKAPDTIKETALSQKAMKDRYASAVHQVALRSFHEVFEADRRGIIRTIALHVGTNTSNPATGKAGFIPILAASTSRETFIEFDLGGVVPLATLKHLGASISKDPFGLIPADLSGIRKS